VSATAASMAPPACTGYLAAKGFETELRAELGEVAAEHGRLMLAPGPPRAAAWARNVWYEPATVEIASIGAAAKALRGLQRNWALYDFRLHRRARLIQDRLPHVSAKPLRFPAPAPGAPLGSWTLIEPTQLLASTRCSSPFPNGEIGFIEDKEAPPNRAYLKLWEAFTLIGRHPEPGERCLDLGASPGGWSWVLASLGAHVLAVDKAPLDPGIAALPGIEFRRASAFALEPAEIGPVDWLCADVVCYPARLLDLVERWLAAGLARNYVCTLKFQGPTDHATAGRFAAIPGSRLMQLCHNKHELTWLKIS
jgi:23S rRNA (cytidine2498-2'-O)-methyltransferase